MLALSKKKDLKVVVEETHDHPRSNRPLVILTELLSGDDLRTTVAKIMTKYGICTRTVAKLYRIKAKLIPRNKTT